MSVKCKLEEAENDEVEECEIKFDQCTYGNTNHIMALSMMLK
jgi:hypothetical protein